MSDIQKTTQTSIKAFFALAVAALPAAFMVDPMFVIPVLIAGGVSAFFGREIQRATNPVPVAIKNDKIS